MPERSARPSAPGGRGGGVTTGTTSGPAGGVIARRDGDERPAASSGALGWFTARRRGRQGAVRDRPAAVRPRRVGGELQRAVLDAAGVLARAPQGETSRTRSAPVVAAPIRTPPRRILSARRRSERPMAISFNCLARSLEPFVPRPAGPPPDREDRGLGQPEADAREGRRPRTTTSAPTSSRSSRAGGRCPSRPGTSATSTTRSCRAPMAAEVRAAFGRLAAIFDRQRRVRAASATGTSAACPTEGRFVVFSDHHMGVRREPSRLLPRRPGTASSTREALTAYADAGFTLVENGDVEELVIHEPTAPPPEMAIPMRAALAPDAARGGHRPPPGRCTSRSTRSSSSKGATSGSPATTTRISRTRASSRCSGPCTRRSTRSTTSSSSSPPTTRRVS